MKLKHTYRNVILYKRFVLFNEPLFRGAVIITSLQKLAHMSLSDIYFMESAVVVLWALFDIPAGALADLIGRKKTIIIGQIFLLGSFIGFALMTSPLTAWISDILWAIGISFQSGADKALLQNSLNECKMGNKFKEIEGRAMGSRYLLIAFCSLVVGPLAEINLRIPLILSVPGFLISFVTSWSFQEPARTKGYNPRAQLRAVREGVAYSVKKKEIRWIVGFCALLMASAKVWFFTYNPYFERVGIELKYYGLIFFLLNLIAWLSSRYAKEIERRLGERSCVTTMILSTGVPMLLMGLFPVQPAAYLVLTQNVVRGFITPFIGDFVNKHIESEHIRATVLSVRSSSTNAATIAALAWFGVMTTRLDLLESLTALGVAVLALGKISFRSYERMTK